jgi:hypothetical protein
MLFILLVISRSPRLMLSVQENYDAVTSGDRSA